MKSIEIQKQCGLTSTLHSLCNGHGVWDKTHLASSYNFHHPCNTIKDLTCHSGDGKNGWPYINTPICIRMIQVSVSISPPGNTNIGASDSGFNLTVIALLTSSDGRWIWRDSPGRRIFRGYELPATPAIASARPRVAGAQVFLSQSHLLISHAWKAAVASRIGLPETLTAIQTSPCWIQFCIRGVSCT